MYSLLKNPDLMRRVVEEVDAVNADGQPTVEKLRRMRWLRAANLETLRHFPIQSVMPFNVERDFEFCGYHVAKGQRVLFASTGFTNRAVSTARSSRLRVTAFSPAIARPWVWSR